MCSIDPGWHSISINLTFKSNSGLNLNFYYILFRLVFGCWRIFKGRSQAISMIVLHRYSLPATANISKLISNSNCIISWHPLLKWYTHITWFDCGVKWNELFYQMNCIIKWIVLSNELFYQMNCIIKWIVLLNGLFYSINTFHSSGTSLITCDQLNQLPSKYYFISYIIFLQTFLLKE